MNTFGYYDLKFPLCDPKAVVANRARFRRDAVPQLGRVNTLRCPAGEEAVSGYVLLPLSEYLQLDPYDTDFELTIDNLVLKNLSIVQAKCVTTGVDSDTNALYLVELTDIRGVLNNEWVQSPLNRQYNMRAPAYPQAYYSSSLDSSLVWTWDTMVEDIWDYIELLGPYPGLPFTPASTPENMYFVGVPALPTLCGILKHVGMVLACDLTEDFPYTIVSSGDFDPLFSSMQVEYTDNLLDDFDWIDVGSGRIPSEVVVYFKYRTEQYGQEETVRNDSYQWMSTRLYEVVVPAATVFLGSYGVHFLHDDFTVRRDFDGIPNSADVAAADAIALERVQQYFDAVYSRLSGSMTQVYSGALPFYTGSQVDCVTWSHKGGWKTTITRGRQ